MDFLRRIEDDVRNLGTEVKRKYPEVREAADKALVTLKTMRESYVAEIMRGGGQNTPKIAKYRSADVAAPYILTCNYVDAAIKTIMLALNGLQMLLNYEVIPPAEAQNILRVLILQAGSGRSEVQLKALQIVLQLANSLAAEPSSQPYLSETNVSGMLQLALQLCYIDAKQSNVSVSSTAFPTVRQLVALIMDGASEALMSSQVDSSISSTSTSSLPQCALLLVTELTHFLHGSPGEWMKGVTVSQSIALDLLHDVVNGWRHLFQDIKPFKELLKHPVSSSLRPLLRTLREDYIACLRSGTNTPSAMTTRVLRAARCLLLNFIKPDFALEAEAFVSLLVHTLQPERGGEPIPILARSASDDPRDASGRPKMYSGDELGSSTHMPGISGNGGLISRLKANAQSGSSSSSSKTPVPAYFFLQLSPINSTVSGNSGLSLMTGSNNAISTSMLMIPAHPAAGCMEALLSLLLSDRVMERMVGDGEGGDALVVTISSIAITVTNLLSEGLSIDANMREFEMAMRSSPLVNLVESVISGSETDTEAIGRALHENLMTSYGATSAEVLVLAFQLTQVISRVLVRCALQSQAKSSNHSDPKTRSGEASGGGSDEGGTRRVFIAASIINGYSCVDEAPISEAMVKAAVSICDKVFESQLEACTTLLQRTEEAGAVRRCLGILSEWALTTGLLGMQRTSDLFIATLCKFTVPSWHGQELSAQDNMNTRSNSVTSSLSARDVPSTELFRWRHVQACARLFQVLHVLADSVTDWDAVLDCLDQLLALIQSPKTLFHEDVTPVELEKICLAIERFKAYSIFISDEALVRLITSMVSLSMNALAAPVASSSSYGQISSSSTTPTGVGSSSSGNTPGQMLGRLGTNIERNINEATANIDRVMEKLPRQLPPLNNQAGGNSSQSSSQISSINNQNMNNNNLNTGGLQINVNELFGAQYLSATSFSLRAAVEITKFNSFRVACIWHMITSHLRMVASHKVSVTRCQAVAATNDIITKALEYMKNPVVPPPSMTFVAMEDVAVSPAMVSGFLSDNLLFNGGVFQSFESVFVPRMYHKLYLDASGVPDLRSQLSQGDLLGTLKALSLVQHADVRADLMLGLLSLLQGGGQAISGGWQVIVELLTSVPASMNSPIAVGDDSASAPSEDSSANTSSNIHSDSVTWPRSSLMTAFTCMTLIVDDFLEVLPVLVIRDVISALSVFSSQGLDVNISLTSVEMLWKVTDFIMTRSQARGDDTASVLQVTMSQLLQLSTDSRPEIRNCATNTLFSAMAANASLLSPGQWKATFLNVVFPLFTRAEERCRLAMHSNEEAIAPELKKGIKMAVHHSRDTAHKQWSETRVLALRGLAKLVRSCTRLLLTEDWFVSTWQLGLGICLRAICAVSSDSEVSLAGSEALFGMLKTVASQSYKAKVRAVRGMRVVNGALVEDVSPSSVRASQAAAANRLNDNNDGAGDKDGVTPEVEDLVEVEAKEALWRLSWAAVRSAVSFSESTNGAELALHLCNQLRDLYNGGIEGEFRYSDNVKMLLEMVTLLARQRHTSVLTGKDRTSDLSILRELFFGKNESRVRIGSTPSDVQLQRGIMQLLRDVNPKDLVSVCCLVSALTELSFGIHFTQLPVAATSGEDRTSTSSKVLLLPVDERLRVEAGEYLVSLLSGSEQVQTQWQAETSGSPVVLPRGHFPASVCLDVVSSRFLCDFCDSLLTARIGAAPSLAQKLAAPPPPPSAATPRTDARKAAGFLTSLGSLFTTTEKAPLSAETPAAARRPTQTLGVTVHRLDVLTPAHPELVNSIPPPARGWVPNPISAPALRLLATAISTCLSLPPNTSSVGVSASTGSAPTASSSLSFANGVEQLWPQILLCLLCALSPWTEREIVGAGYLSFLNDTSNSSSKKSQTTPVTEEDGGSGQSPLSNSLSSVVSYGLDQRVRPQFLALLVDAITVSCRLSIHAVAEIVFSPTGSSGEGNGSPLDAKQTATQVSCLETLEMCGEHLGRLCSAQSLSLIPRQRALLGMLLIAQDLTDIILRMRSTSFYATSVIAAALRHDCGQFLMLIATVPCTLDMLTPGFTCQFEPQPDLSSAVLTEWSRIAADLLTLSTAPFDTTDTESAAGSGSGNKVSEVVSTVNAVDEVEAKSAVLLAIPLAVRLLTTCITEEEDDIRQSAAQLISAVDFGQLLGSYGAYVNASRTFEMEKQQLQDDLASVRNAASLPF